MSSKYNIDFEFLSYLKELGRKCAEKWLSAHWDDLGKRSSIDIRKIFLGEA
jgi:NTE family protein